LQSQEFQEWKLQCTLNSLLQIFRDVTGGHAVQILQDHTSLREWGVVQTPPSVLLFST